MSLPDPLRPFAIGLALTAAIGLAACDALPGSPSADEIADRMIAAQEDPRPIHSTSVMTLTFAIPGTESPDAAVNMLMDTETWSEGPSKQRVEATTTLSSEDEILAGFMENLRISTTAVRSGQTMWLLMQPQNLYVEMDLDELEGAAASPEQSAYMLREMVREMVDAYDLTLLGTEAIAGTTTYKLRAEPRTGIAGAQTTGAETTGAVTTGDGIASRLGIGTATLWVDPDTYAIRAMDANIRPPASAELEAMDVDYNAHLRMRTTGYVFGADLPEGVFTFMPPDGATEINADQFASPGAGFLGR